MGKRTWTPERIIEELRRCRANGPRSNRLVDDAARRYFGSLRVALEVAGLPCRRPKWRRRRWSHERVVAAIQQRNDCGKDLMLTNREDRALYEAAKRIYGSWSAALQAAGFVPPSPEVYTADEVRLIIIEMYERELPLTLHSQKDVKLRRSVRRHFGTWRRAVESLGLGSELPRNWTEEAIIEAICQRHSLCENILGQRGKNSGLYHAAVKRFGSWQKAFEAARVDYRCREQWTEEKVVTRLLQHLQNMPMSRIRSVDPRLVVGAERRFGSLRKAVRAAHEASKRGKR